MLGVGFLKIVTNDVAMTGGDIAALLLGMAVAYVVSLAAIRFLMDYVKKHNFKAFGVYRIVLGVVVILYFGIRALVKA